MVRQLTARTGTHTTFSNSHAALETDAINTSHKVQRAFQCHGDPEHSDTLSRGMHCPVCSERQQCDRTANAIASLPHTPGNSLLFPLLCLCLGRKKGTTLNAKVHAVKANQVSTPVRSNTVCRYLMKRSGQRHFVFSWDESHWSILKYHYRPRQHGLLIASCFGPCQPSSHPCCPSYLMGGVCQHLPSTHLGMGKALQGHGVWSGGGQLLCVTAQSRLKRNAKVN